MPYLDWIDDDKLIASVQHLISKAVTAKAKTNIHKNVVDPFSAVFEMAGFELGYEDWIENELSRQAQKTLQNHIGDFHQNILGFSNKWINKKTGNVVDLVSEELKIIAEVKNKFNTISGGKLSDLYNTFDSLIMPKASIYKGYTAYYVAIIPKKGVRYNTPFVPSNKEKGEKCPVNEKIREIDGASFYALVTGRENALKELFLVLPDVIFECSKGQFKIGHREGINALFELAYK